MPIKFNTVLYPVGKERIIHAVKCRIVTAKNYISIANWAANSSGKAIAIVARNKAGVESKQRVKLDIKRGTKIAQVGDAIAFLGDGNFVVIKAADFDAYSLI